MTSQSKRQRDADEESQQTTQDSKRSKMTTSITATASNDHTEQQVIDSSSNSETKHITVTESTGDLFAVPPNSILVHACNCQGSWGAGIAAAFKKNYPAAYTVYADHCQKHGKALLGTCLLIPPQSESKSKSERDKSHWVGCLFTSNGKGKTKGTKQSILDATDPSMLDLVAQVRAKLSKASDDKHDSSSSIGEVKMCKINSGLFGVPWASTKRVLESIEITEDGVKNVEVISREE